MAPLPPFTVPLLSNGPPAGYGWEECGISVLPTTTSFNTGIDQRDVFLGQRCCIICGESDRPLMHHCHIIGKEEDEMWADLKTCHWLPPQAKDLPRNEPRNGLYLCANHHLAFDSRRFFIRYYPDKRKFVLINYSGSPSFQAFHGKAIGLDVENSYVPYPSLFIVHEILVRASHPFKPIAPDIPDDVPWQDWILANGVFNNTTNSFNHGSLPGNDNNNIFAQPQFHPTTATAGGASSGGRMLLSSVA